MRSQLVRVQINQLTCVWNNNFGIETHCAHFAIHEDRSYCKLYKQQLEYTTQSYYRCSGCLRDKTLIQTNRPLV